MLGLNLIKTDFCLKGENCSYIEVERTMIIMLTLTYENIGVSLYWYLEKKTLVV